MKMTARSMTMAALMFTSAAHAHHLMGNDAPTTLLQGFLSGLGHPVIGVDHLAFIIAAGVLAARYPRGLLLALLFVAGSTAGAALHVGGLDLPAAEWWIAATLLLIGFTMVRRGQAFTPAVAAFYAIAGYAHGYALAESIVGAETTPLAGYFAGLIVIQAVLAGAAYAGGRWFARYRPGLPVTPATGVLAGIAGLTVLTLVAWGA